MYEIEYELNFETILPEPRGHETMENKQLLKEYPGTTKRRRGCMWTTMDILHPCLPISGPSKAYQVVVHAHLLKGTLAC